MRGYGTQTREVGSFGFASASPSPPSVRNANAQIIIVKHLPVASCSSSPPFPTSPSPASDPKIGRFLVLTATSGQAFTSLRTSPSLVLTQPPCKLVERRSWIRALSQAWPRSWHSTVMATARKIETPEDSGHRLWRGIGTICWCADTLNAAMVPTIISSWASNISPFDTLSQCAAPIMLRGPALRTSPCSGSAGWVSYSSDSSSYTTRKSQGRKPVRHRHVRGR